jgi:NADPH2 dehydrogenase
MSSDLLSPLSFAGLHLRNRIVMPPMWSGQAGPDGGVTDAIVEYHRVRAEAGCGLVIVEHAFVHHWGRHSATQMGVHDDAMVEGLAGLASAIRGTGAVACLQLSHAGSRSSAKVLGRTPLAPSAVRHPYEPQGDVPEAMTSEAIRETVLAFGSAAVRARRAGFDAVEIHAAHGFLLSEFLSPLTNHRTDGYGGSEDRRVRLHLEVLEEVARRGDGIPVFVRLGSHDETPGGLEIDAAARAADKLVQAGAALIDVSGGLCGSRPAGRTAGYFVAYAEAIKARVGVPIVVTGGITEAEHADRIVREGRADLVGIGRAMLNDAQWARKAIDRLGSAR